MERRREERRIDDLAPAVGLGAAALAGLVLWAVVIALAVAWLG